MALAGLAFLVFMVLVAVFGPMYSPYRIEETSAQQFEEPSLKHWFGTDLHGRDVLTRVMWGGRLSLLVGFAAAIVSLAVGVLYGAIAGYRGGRTDRIMMRIVDILYSLPNLVFVIVLIAFLEEGLRKLFSREDLGFLLPYTRILLLLIGLGTFQWLTMARIVRGQVLSLREQQFVLASRALGARTWRIIRRHLIPNVAGPVLAYLTLTVPAVMLREAFLSFLGLGIQPPQASWGSLVADGAALLNPIKSCWWLVFFPGLAMALTLLSLNFLGDGLRDALDPKSQKSW
jgi:peptide/nickel transport system permease protein/oligopeptide transport system permease protein